jgi:hypothetical protein
MSTPLLPGEPNRRRARDFTPFFWFLLSGIALAGFIMAILALKCCDQGVIDQITNGTISTSNHLQYLGGSSGALQMTLSAAQLAAMVNGEFTIISTTVAAHTITLSGGATWVAGGSQTVATWPATAGTGIVFRVVSSTLLVVTANNGPVVFS